MLHNCSNTRTLAVDIAIDQHEGDYILYGKTPHSAMDSAVNAGVSIKQLFEPRFLKAQRLVDKVAWGRGETLFFSLNDIPLVLRSYRRGGLVAKALSDSYLWLGLKHTRAYRELAMLLSLSASHLPAPKPFAARVTRDGCGYRADIITHALTDTETLSERLQHAAIDDSVWQTIGTTIAAFHQAGVYHADLNAHNILLDSNNAIFLIDFDKARFKNPHPIAWRQRNLQRLQRSLVKIKNSAAVFYFNEKHWAQLAQSYLRSWCH